MSEETHVYYCHTALAVGDEFFAKTQFMTMEDLSPVFHALCRECDGKIEMPGIYAFRLQVVEIK